MPGLSDFSLFSGSSCAPRLRSVAVTPRLRTPTLRRRLAIVLTTVATLGLVVAGVLARAGDEPRAPAAFCRAATRYEHELERRGSRSARAVERQIELVERLAATAPRSISEDVQTFLDAMRRVQHDPDLVDNPRIRRAVEAVNRFAAQRCGFFDRQPGQL